MFGTFTEDALEQYAELVRFRERKVKGGQGTEKFDNLGVGESDSSFIDSDESMNASDYSETWDYTTCVRSDGSFYGIASGKKCRKGTEGKKPVKERTPKQKQREAIQKRDEKAVKRVTAERILRQLQAEGEQGRKEEKRAVARFEKEGARNRTEAVQNALGRTRKALDQLEARRKRAKAGSEMAVALERRIARLNSAYDKLLKLKKQGDPWTERQIRRDPVSGKASLS